MLRLDLSGVLGRIPDNLDLTIINNTAIEVSDNVKN